jgi:hypothetical protein
VITARHVVVERDRVMVVIVRVTRDRSVMIAADERGDAPDVTRRTSTTRKLKLI